MNNIQFHRIGMADLEDLKLIGKKTFVESFSWGNATENMQMYLDKAFADQQLLNEINDPGSAFYFARVNDIPIGYIKINSGNAQTEIRDMNGMEIERIYVLGEFQGMKVGQLLFEHVVKIAKARNLEYIWLGVWEKNPKAIKFYERNGFKQFATHVFKVGNDEQTDVMMKLDLKKQQL